ncbi:MAG: zinc-dependent alcohol dehydrogenase family protein [bacterium]|nr:zinc-dependent alcohol dehydrogenase family protein [bacterium]MDI1335470.1 zinc-dependent alcohol dehydrogenase family protein [Lacunisphaera sp.]
MRALVYHGANHRAWEEKPQPALRKPTDAIIRISKTTICGTDLHIMKGDLPKVVDGLTLGHEGVGVVVEAGAAVTNFKPGDRVVISCVTSCGKCPECKRGMPSHCADGGWILGYLIDGTQAEFVRIPHADGSLHHIPADVTDEEPLVMVSDILPTGFECGVLNGCIKPGDTVAIIGAGPVGLSTLLTAQFYAPAVIIMVDLDENRLEVAKTFGATHTVTTNAAAKIMKLTGGKGVDVAIEAVGLPATFQICQDIVAAGGHLANIGVHGRSVELHLESLWDRNLTLTTRLVDTVTIPLLMKTVRSGKVKPAQLITHRFPLNEIMKAYDVFGNAARERALKVILTN